MLHDMKSSACKKIKSKFYYLSHCEIIKNKTDKKMTRAVLLVGKSWGNSGSLLSCIQWKRFSFFYHCTWRPNSVNNKIFIFFIQPGCSRRRHFLPFLSTESIENNAKIFIWFFQIGQKEQSHKGRKTLENHRYQISRSVDKLDQFFSSSAICKCGVDYHPKTMLVTYNLEL